MSESVRQDLPMARSDERIELPASEEQNLVLRKAAELVGWTVPQYVLSAALDRAERDLYEHAAVHAAAQDRKGREEGPRTGPPHAPVAPYVAIVAALE
ncbi:hypothetical protein GCM10023085_36780 [Actinomadura viridis]|uniref:DUF1778 domain-containing protein n=1 Tax=Actinomadura viridis TaxID=58110 RepID=A0A931DEN3_9ACTN|nr:DUF1778 domain-containing protein [Actinomadura viridis]MBG6087787.1 hypothetical protein [Actinomadura viridis]